MWLPNGVCFRHRKLFRVDCGVLVHQVVILIRGNVHEVAACPAFPCFPTFTLAILHNQIDKLVDEFDRHCILLISDNGADIRKKKHPQASEGGFWKSKLFDDEEW